MIELIVPTNKRFSPTAMRFGSDILDLNDVRSFAKHPHTPFARAAVLASMQCGLTDEKLVPDVWKSKWMDSPEVQIELEHARHRQVVTARVTKAAIADATRIATMTRLLEISVDDTTITHGQWKLCPEKSLLKYAETTMPIPRRHAKMLKHFLTNIGKIFTCRDLYEILHNRPMSARDTTIPTAVSQTRKICGELTCGNDLLIDSNRSVRGYWVTPILKSSMM